KYKDTIEKVISKGSTPAGMHISIMVDEIIDFLDIKPGQKGLDVTLGYGGHTSHMLEKLGGQGHMYGLDVDPIEIQKTTKRLEEKGYGSDVFTPINTNFKNIDEVAKKYGPFDFILADLGVSSMQIDNPERGFTYKFDGPLDLRLDPHNGVSAAERIRNISVDELEAMLVENADEPYANEIAREVVSRNKGYKKIETTTDLKKAIERALSKIPEKDRKEAVKKSCARTFQALRIDVNNEFEVLFDLLEKLPGALAPGGRVAVLTFHSGEDRLVKKSFKEFKRMGIYSDVARDVIRPSSKECHINPRAKSTKMRWAIKS
ncbi:MAG: 16S rRNA (cytosine(1402)-N(4))-methyltransferase RsmH, partial [Lachnospiraceae bacterium]|nr:16S rRNA (cytosine(1402)-N(4))-methyltransferase RsmH [Lachnospiraceae bacterium]